MSVVLQTSIDIQATTDEVWEVLADFPAYGQWSNFNAIEGAAEQGTRIRVRMPGMSFRPTLTVVAPGRELEWAAKILTPRLFYGRHNFAIAPHTDGTTRVTNTEIFTGVLVLPAQPFFRHGAGADSGYDAFNSALKKRVEDNQRR